MKLIGITMRRDNDNKWRENRDSISEDWVKYLSNFLQDYKFIPIPNDSENALKIVSAFDIDGLILSNGNDWGSCIERDKTEITLIEWCRKFRKPILGICRGFQVLNQYFGGKLQKDLTKITSDSHAGAKHKIQIIDKKIISNSLKKEFFVNSYHNEGVISFELAKNLVPFAKAKNIIEGFYHYKEPIIGIQWHIERDNFEKEFDKHLLNILFKKSFHQAIEI